MMDGKKAVGGTKTIIVLSPIKIESTPEVKSLDRKKRKCGIPEDVGQDDPVFKVRPG